MAGNFVGMLVELTLKSPPGATVLGRVASIDGNSLELTGVFFPKLQQSLPAYAVPSAAIADLQIVETQQKLNSVPALPTKAPHAPVDPAILSFGGPGTELNRGYPPIDAVDRPEQIPPVELANAPASKASRVPGNVTFGGISNDTKEAPISRSSVPTHDAENTKPSSVKKNRRPKKTKQQHLSELQADENGWGSEDASGIQDLPEFDFAANLSKFDKRSVFEQIRIEDTTADEDRLVSHNRLPKARPGTYGGKNLHPTDNVLSPTRQASEQFDTQSHSESDAAMPHILHEKLDDINHTTIGRNGHAKVRPLVSPMGTGLRNSSSRNSHRVTSSRAESAISAHNRNITDSSPRFTLTSSGLVCPTYDKHFLRHDILDTQIHDIDPQIYTALCARGIAQMMTNTIVRQPAPSRRSSRTSLHTHGSHSRPAPLPVIVVVVGNHLRGAQTIAAVRQLYGRGYKILLSVADLHQPQHHCPDLAEQLQHLRSLGKKTARVDGWHGISSQVKRLTSPPALIVDALLDGSTYNSIHDASFALEVRETIDWINRSRACVLSIECPSGYDASTAETTLLEGEPMAVIPDRVLALGAPVHGLLEAAKDREKWSECISCADVGIQPALGAEGLVPFGLAEWLVDLQYADDAEE